jgi:hypothetical protein
MIHALTLSINAITLSIINDEIVPILYVGTNQVEMKNYGAAGTDMSATGAMVSLVASK